MTELIHPGRILFLTPQLPFPPEQGTAIRNLGLMQQVAKSHAIALLSFRADSREEGPVLHDLCERVWTESVPGRTRRQRLRTLLTTRDPDMAWRLRSETFWRSLQQAVEEWHPDIVMVEGVELAPYAFMLQDWLGERCPAIIFDSHNAEYLLQKRAAMMDLQAPRRWPAAAYSLVQWLRLRRYEREACLTASAVLAVSGADARALQALAPGLEPTVVPNGVDVARYRSAASAALALRRPALVFTGKMDYRPNVDAVVWFCQAVLPLVQAAEPAATFYIVGKDPSPAVRGLASLAGVVVTGYVPDALPYIAGADVYVVPLRVGGGTRLKILEAMASSTALVSTHLGAEGIDLKDGVHALLVDGAVPMASAVVNVLRDVELRGHLASAGQRFVAEHYDWAHAAARLEQVYARLLGPRTAIV